MNQNEWDKFLFPNGEEEPKKDYWRDPPYPAYWPLRIGGGMILIVLLLEFLK